MGAVAAGFLPVEEADGDRRGGGDPIRRRGAPSSKENGRTTAVDAVVLLAEEAGRRRADQPELELKLSSAMATAWHGEAYLGGGEGRKGGNGKRRSRARHKTC